MDWQKNGRMENCYKADHAEEGLIKFVSIEIAMEKYFNQMG